VTDRAVFFLGSLFCVLCALAAIVWLIVGGQLGTFDGNYLLVAALVVGGAFGLYLKYLISQARESPPKQKPTLAASKEKKETTEQDLVESGRS